MLLTIWQHLTLAWAMFALFVIFILRYGMDKQRTHPYFSQGLLIGYLTVASVTFWPLMAAPHNWRLAAILPLAASVIGLEMIKRGTVLERTGGTARIPNDDGGQLVGQGGGVAIAGLLLGLILLSAAALFIETAASLIRA